MGGVSLHRLGAHALGDSAIQRRSCGIARMTRGGFVPSFPHPRTMLLRPAHLIEYRCHRHRS